jgi:ABC-type sugar transport system substrate-binding protein
MMFTRRTVLSITFGTMVAVVLDQRAHAREDGKKIRIAFANFSDEAVFGAVVLKGIKDAAKAHDNLELTYYDNRQDAAKSIENARTIVATRPDFVVWFCSIPDVNVTVGRLFKEASLSVITVQVPMPGVPFFAVDNALSGHESAKALTAEARKRWPSVTPEILMINWPEMGPMFVERGNSAKESLKGGFPNANITKFSAIGDPNRARQQAADFLTRNPNNKILMWVFSDAYGVSALAAARNAGREDDVLVATTGGDSSVFPEIRKARTAFVGSFSFFPELWGADLLNAAIKGVNGEKLPARISPTRQLFLSSANIAQYYPQ